MAEIKYIPESELTFRDLRLRAAYRLACAYKHGWAAFMDQDVAGLHFQAAVNALDEKMTEAELAQDSASLDLGLRPSLTHWSTTGRLRWEIALGLGTVRTILQVTRPLSVGLTKLSAVVLQTEFEWAAESPVIPSDMKVGEMRHQLGWIDGLDVGPARLIHVARECGPEVRHVAALFKAMCAIDPTWVGGEKRLGDILWEIPHAQNLAARWFCETEMEAGHELAAVVPAAAGKAE